MKEGKKEERKAWWKEGRKDAMKGGMEGGGRDAGWREGPPMLADGACTGLAFTAHPFRGTSASCATSCASDGQLAEFANRTNNECQ